MNGIPASTPTEESISASTSTTARWGFWGTCLWGVLIGFVFVALQSVTILVGAVVRSPNGFSPSEPGFVDLIAAAAENGTLVSIATLITAVVCCGLIAGVVKLKKGATVGEYLSLGGVPGRTWLNWLGATAVLVVLSDLTTIALGATRRTRIHDGALRHGPTGLVAVARTGCRRAAIRRKRSSGAFSWQASRTVPCGRPARSWRPPCFGP